MAGTTVPDAQNHTEPESAAVALVRALYSAFRARDRDRITAILAPDVVWRQSPGFPGGSVRTGADLVLTGVVGAFEREWDGWGFRPDRFLDAGTSVIVLGAYVATHRLTGRPLRSETAHVFDLRDGRIVGFTQFSDTAVIRDAATA